MQGTWQIIVIIYGFCLFLKGLDLLLGLLSFRQPYVKVLKADHGMQIKALTTLLKGTLLG